MLDIEDVMSKIKLLADANMPTIINELNTEKNDTLLSGEFGYNADAYRTWEMGEMPPYPVSFLQYIPKEPDLIGTAPSYDIGLKYTISIICFIADTGNSDWVKLKHRYNRVLVSFIKQYIVPRYNGVQIYAPKSVLYETNDGGRAIFDSAEVQFSLCLTL